LVQDPFNFTKKTVCKLLLFSTLVAEMLKKLHATHFFHKEIEKLRPTQASDGIFFRISFLILKIACNG